MKGTKKSCQFQVSNFQNQFELKEQNHFFCNFVIFKTNSNLAVSKHLLLQGFGNIVKANHLHIVRLTI